MSARKLEWTLDPTGSAAILQGNIDENSDLPALAAALKGQSVTFDLGGVRRINSLGVRQWIMFIKSLAGHSVALRRCSPAVVEQINCVRDFCGHAKIESVLLPYICEECGTFSHQEMKVSSPQPAPFKMPPDPPCAKCGKPCVFDDFPDRYLSFLIAK